MELARSGGAIGSYSCSGRRGRGDPIACSCTARPCTQGGGETEVRIELRIPPTRAAPRQTCYICSNDMHKQARTPETYPDQPLTDFHLRYRARNKKRRTR